MTELRGVGIGLGIAHGPIARMAEPLPAPDDVPSTLGADAETTRVKEAIAAVARELEQRGETAGGAAQEVLEAQAMMAEDPALEDEVASRLAAGKTGEFAV
ncbi:MAG TPA: phosphoenolpyruvate--protein phosphotransferase, partial [Microbacterium sp.]|nr:phosphoenolpyruvate--protein phosphotransferase [Microbacterium sp.]